MCLTDSEVVVLRKEALSILMTSELLSDSDAPWTQQQPPGSSQYLLSLARLALSASVEIPELWPGGGSQLAGDLLLHLLCSCQYEVRELALDGVLKALQQENFQQQGLQQDLQPQSLQQQDHKGRRRPEWLDGTTLSHLTSAALQETHPQCLAKVRPHT